MKINFGKAIKAGAKAYQSGAVTKAFNAYQTGDYTGLATQVADSAAARASKVTLAKAPKGVRGDAVKAATSSLGSTANALMDVAPPYGPQRAKGLIDGLIDGLLSLFRGRG